MNALKSPHAFATNPSALTEAENGRLFKFPTLGPGAPLFPQTI
jgi:hypothetical protein